MTAPDTGTATSDRQRVLEEAANRLALVSRWADDLAHEIKNPLHAMVINLELVKRRAGDDPDALVERAEVVESELHRVHDLVDSLLRLVRPWPDVHTADAAQIFDQLLPVLMARSRVRRLDYRHEGDHATLPMAPADLALVILNLVDIAFEASPQGGTVVTTCGTREDLVTITVQDQGPGGSDEGATADGGGLAISARLVERAGGRLTSGPAPGGGSLVTVAAPRGNSA